MVEGISAAFPVAVFVFDTNKSLCPQGMGLAAHAGMHNINQTKEARQSHNNFAVVRRPKVRVQVRLVWPKAVPWFLGWGPPWLRRQM